MLELKNISKSYGKNESMVLKDLSLEFDEGNCLAIVGGSGCGKTTLISIIAGIIEPSEGEVFFNGKNIKNIRDDIAVVFQGYGLFPWKTVRKNVILPLQLKHEKSEFSLDVKKIFLD